MARRIQLVRTPQQVYSPYTSLSLSFTVDAQNAYLMPNEVFKMVRHPLDPNNPNTTTDTLVGICNPDDLVTLPVDNPSIPGGFFRVAHILLIYTSATLAETGWSEIQSTVTALVNSLNAQDVGGVPETVWIGTPP